MPSLIPSAPALLRATADHLEQELLPTLQGHHRFQTRIAINVLRTVTRELELAPGLAAAERQRLAGLLGHEAPVATLNDELATRLADGSLALDTPGLAEHLQQTLVDALTINNPKWIASDSVDPPSPRNPK